MNRLDTARRYSLFLARNLDSGKLKPEIFLPMLDKVLTEADFQAFADWDKIRTEENEEELARQLRELRRYVVSQIIVRDINRISDLNEVTRTITLFADFAVNTALDFSYAYYQDMYGTPIGRYTKSPQHLSVVAMGKAGGYELNVSSDIDLIFVYPESGDTDGRRERGNQEFFTKVGQKLIALLNDITADGQVFRVDMRLRPDGDSGALVLSETALEQYLITQGREWERYAWCKGRVVTPYPNDIKSLVRPFVFRKYLDYSAYEAMRNLHRQIRSEVSKKGMADNIKLGAGGIREVEFIAQIFQMIRGGQMRALQLKGTQETLKKLAELGIMPSENVETLLAAYRFLRDVEHRLQYWDDQQTQTLPSSPEQQQLLAESMGFDSYAAFLDGLNVHRNKVNQLFNEILSEPEEQTQSNSEWQWAWQEKPDEEERLGRLKEYGFDAETIATRLDQIRNGHKYRHLSAHAQPRFDAIVPLLVQAAVEQPNPTETLMRLFDFLENISRRSAYLAFLNEHPQTLAHLAQIMSQSSWVAAYLSKYPILLDELISAQLLDTAFDWQVLAAALPCAWADMPKKHRDTPQFAVVGYGKLGGKELGYASDLDLIYLYDDPHPDAGDVYSRLARRLTNWLSAATGAGSLYETDLRLRPNGDAGFLAHSIAAFEKYQRENAWTWEHQSLTRARFICGTPDVQTAFDRIRTEMLTAERDQTVLAGEIIEMREKMFPTHPPSDSNVKYARGGVVDVEFIVQYLILAHALQYPQLLDNYGNIALLNIAADCGLIDKTLAEQSRTAYRFYRQQQHNTKLRDTKKTEVTDELLTHYGNVRKLWQEVFGAEVKFG